MKSVAGVYGSHAEAIKAVRALKHAGYAPDQISLVGRAVMISDKTFPTANTATDGCVGTMAGTALCDLKGVNISEVQGLGYLYSAGALGSTSIINAVTEKESTVANILGHIGIDECSSQGYEQLLADNKFLIFVQDSPSGKAIDRAENLLQTATSGHLQIDSH